MQAQEIDSKAEARRAEQAKYAFRLFGCASTGCLSSGSKSVLQTIKDELTAAGIAEQVEIVPTGCMGLCSLGPLVRVEQKDGGHALYKEVNNEIAKAIVREHVVPASKGQAVSLESLKGQMLALDLPFFTRQVRVVLENAGCLDPERLDDYLAAGGYRAIAKVLSTMTPEQVIEEIRVSGLRGRGGAGFPTATKWDLTRKATGEIKYAVCNGDEGDPGAYMDRCVLEADPHAVIEGMMIGAYAMGAQQGVFYIRAEYPLAVDRVNKAIKDARKAGLLGKNLFGSSFSFDCEVRLGAGAFVCGEETALLASIEGRRGTPSPRPPFPSIKGLWGMPTAINNVETLANVPRIINKGGAWFASMGTDRSKGTKVFALTGKAKYSGLVEVPMGMSLREIVFDIGGGSGSGKAVTIIQTGGPSGGMIPEKHFDTPVSYEHLQQLGSIMGSGGMIVMDESDSPVELSRFYLEFTVDESCGKCAPCRIGGHQLLTLLGRIAKGEGTQRDMKMAKRVALAMQRASLCGLGQTAPNPVLSAMKYFPEDFARRLRPEPKKQSGCTCCESASESPKA
jgi:NADH:ubiquinone oxidoreductase subunit F (NADH-binding)/(2Fe-2S) ferredoxin